MLEKALITHFACKLPSRHILKEPRFWLTASFSRPSPKPWRSWGLVSDADAMCEW